MAPISRLLAAGFLLISVTSCAPLPEEAPYDAEKVYNTIQKFEATITDDPHHVTDTWGGVNKNIPHGSEATTTDEHQTEDDNEGHRKNESQVENGKEGHRENESQVENGKEGHRENESQVENGKEGHLDNESQVENGKEGHLENESQVENGKEGHLENESQEENGKEGHLDNESQEENEDPCKQKPGYKGKHHSSGKHSTVNYDELCGSGA